MRGRMLVMAMALVLVLQAVARAHPPHSINLTYNTAEKKLHMEIEHVSKNKRDRVYKVIVYKNDAEVTTLKYTKQTSVAVLISDISLEAIPGDALRVKAVSNEGGFTEQALTVP